MHLNQQNNSLLFLRLHLQHQTLLHSFLPSLPAPKELFLFLPSSAPDLFPFSLTLQAAFHASFQAFQSLFPCFFCGIIVKYSIQCFHTFVIIFHINYLSFTTAGRSSDILPSFPARKSSSSCAAALSISSSPPFFIHALFSAICSRI